MKVTRRRMALLATASLFASLLYVGVLPYIFVRYVPLPFVGLAMVLSAIGLAFFVAHFIFGSRWPLQADPETKR